MGVWPTTGDGEDRVTCVTPQYHGTKERGGITVQVQGEVRGRGKLRPPSSYELD